MPSQTRLLRKSYAMSRMGKAIERAIAAPNSKEKTRAAKWAAAWGLLCGIKTNGTYLRSDAATTDERNDSSEQIEIPPMESAVRAVSATMPPAFTLDQDGDEASPGTQGSAAPH